MSRKPDDLELEYIYQIANGSQKVQDLIQAKYNETVNLKNNQYSKFTKPEPKPKPKGDISIPKKHVVKRMSDKEFDQKIKESNAKFDKEIKQEMDTLVNHPNHEPIRDMVQDMPAKDLATVSEKGGEIYKQLKEREEKEVRDSLKFDLDDVNNTREYSQRDMFLENSKDIDKAPSPSDDFE